MATNLPFPLPFDTTHGWLLKTEDYPFYEDTLEGAQRELARAEECTLRMMLGMWISELEPEIYRDHRTCRLRGLGYGGQMMTELDEGFYFKVPHVRTFYRNQP